MGCGCKGGGGRVTKVEQLQQQSAAMVAATNSGEYDLVRYTGAMQGRVFRAPSGNAYRFSPEEPEKLVLKNDIDWFLKMREFQTVQLVQV